MSAPSRWKPTPAAKVYEAFSAVADGRVHPLDGRRAEVESSGRDRSYTVEWNDDLTSVTSNDNASYWQGYLGYPAVAVLLTLGALQADRAIVALFAGVPWHELNARFRRDYDAAADSVLATLTEGGVERDRVVAEVDAVLAQLAGLGLQRPPRARRPPKAGHS